MVNMENLMGNLKLFSTICYHLKKSIVFFYIIIHNGMYKDEPMKNEPYNF